MTMAAKNTTVKNAPKGKGKPPAARPVPTVQGNGKFAITPDVKGAIPTAGWREGTPIDYAIRIGEGEVDWAGSPLGTGQAAVNAILARSADPMSKGEIRTRVAALKVVGRNGEPYHNVSAACTYLLHRQLAVHVGGKWQLTPLARTLIGKGKGKGKGKK